MQWNHDSLSFMQTHNYTAQIKRDIYIYIHTDMHCVTFNIINLYVCVYMISLSNL